MLELRSMALSDHVIGIAKVRVPVTSGSKMISNRAPSDSGARRSKAFPGINHSRGFSQITSIVGHSISRSDEDIYTLTLQKNSLESLKSSILQSAIMAGLKVGDTFPDDVEFSYVPWSPETASAEACGIPIQYKASQEFKDKVLPHLLLSFPYSRH